MHSYNRQQIQGVFDLVYSHFALRILAVVERLFRENWAIAVSQVEDGGVESTGHLISICRARGPVVIVEDNPENLRVKQVMKWNASLQQDRETLLKEETWDEVVLEFHNIVYHDIHGLDLVVLESIVNWCRDEIAFMTSLLFHLTFVNNWKFFAEIAFIIFTK